MRNLFNPDNAIMNFIGKLLDCFFLNVLWLVCCIPVVTIGASTTALYYCSIKLAKDEPVSVLHDFFHSFRANFIPATKITLLFLAVGIILGLDGFIFLHFPIRGALWCIGMGFWLYFVFATPLSFSISLPCFHGLTIQ